MFAARIQTFAPPTHHGFIIARIDDPSLTLATSWASQRSVSPPTAYLVGARIIRYYG